MMQQHQAMAQMQRQAERPMEASPLERERERRPSSSSRRRSPSRASASLSAKRKTAMAAEKAAALNEARRRAETRKMIVTFYGDAMRASLRGWLAAAREEKNQRGAVKTEVRRLEKEAAAAHAANARAAGR